MGKMHKTTKSYCKKCRYHGDTYMGSVICNYYSITKNRRGCEVGKCDKFEKGKPDRALVNIKITPANNSAYFGVY